MDVLNYELMVIGNPKTDSEKFLAQVKKILEESNAVNLKVDRLGKKLLAYPIAKQTEGEYLVFNFEAEPQVIFEISSALRLEREAVLRYLITRVSRVSRVPRVSQVEEKTIAEATEAAKSVVAKTKRVAAIAKVKKVTVKSKSKTQKGTVKKSK